MRFVLLIYYIFFLLSCKKKSDDRVKKIEYKGVEKEVRFTKGESNAKESKKEKIDWSSIPVNELPFSSMTIQKDTVYKRRKKMYKNSILNNFFSDSTLFKTKMYDSLYGFSHEHPSKMKGLFLYRLPDLNTKKILIYGYQEKYGSGYKGYTYELQVFDESFLVVDKLILQDSYLYECGYKRKFSIDKGYKISILDKYNCTALEKEDSHLNRSKTVKNSFNITPQGKITAQ